MAITETTIVLAVDYLDADMHKILAFVDPVTLAVDIHVFAV